MALSRGKVLITGASSGLGSALAKRLAALANGAPSFGLHLCGRNQDNLDQVADECQALAGSSVISTFVGDLAHADAADRMWEAYISCHGPVRPSNRLYPCLFGPVANSPLSPPIIVHRRRGGQRWNQPARRGRRQHFR